MLRFPSAHGKSREKNSVWPGARWKRNNVTLIIRNATCNRTMFYLSSSQPLWYLCTSCDSSFTIKSRVGASWTSISTAHLKVISCLSHFQYLRASLCVIYHQTIKKIKQIKSCKQWCSEKTLSLQKIMPLWQKCIHPNSLVMFFTFLFTQI